MDENDDDDDFLLIPFTISLLISLSLTWYLTSKKQPLWQIKHKALTVNSHNVMLELRKHGPEAWIFNGRDISSF